MSEQEREFEAEIKAAIEQYPYDTRIIDRVFAHYYPRLRRFARSYTRNQEAAEDVVQIALMNAYRALPKFRFEASFRSYLFRAVLNECRRHSKRQKPDSGLDVDALPETELRAYSPAAEQRRLEVFAIFARMEPNEADALRLFYYEDFSIAEISAIIGVGPSAMKMRLQRAREHFARLWNE